MKKDRDILVDRFIKYVKIDTPSDPKSKTCPSTKDQMALAKVIAKDLKDIGLTDVSVDKNGYVMATLPGNVPKAVTIGFLAHMDTAPTFNGYGVKPNIIKKYKGGDIVLNKKENIKMLVKDFPNLNKYIGQDLITTDGTSLLGADDKAGAVEIIEAMRCMIADPKIKHGTIKVAFTPDEEIGRGPDKFDVKKFGCKFAYTADGGELGELEYETFNAAAAVIKITGRDIHPGTSKNKMINSMLLAMELHSMLPVNERPEYTEGYEGFFLLINMSGTVENTTMQYIIRDHSMEKFKIKKDILKKAVKYIADKYPKAQVKLDISDTYYNMLEKIKPVMYTVELAQRSMQELGIEPIIKPVRGGTDGSKLSYMGLPCPNLFTGGENYHGKYEFVSIDAMEKCRELIIKISENAVKMKK